MAKNKGYYLNRVALEKIIGDFCIIRGSECLNPANQQTRYSLEKNGINFFIDVFFRKNNTITVTPVQKGSSEIATELCGLIRDGAEYKDVVSGTFTTQLSSMNFNDLREYLGGLPGVTCVLDEDKGQNGVVVKYITDFGDSVTLTYYESRQKLYFQGLLMNLYVIIKTFIAPLVGNVVPTKITQGSHDSEEDKVNKHIQSYLPKGFNLLDPIMADFIRDSFTLVVVGTKLRDYAAWAMPTIRVLEHCIKRLCLENNVLLRDEQGFKYYINSTDTAFVFYTNNGRVVVNRNLQSSFDSDTLDVLVRCYEFLKANRHEMFHTTQIVQGTKLVPTPEEAYTIIQGSCKLIEESLVFNLKQSA